MLGLLAPARQSVFSSGVRCGFGASGSRKLVVASILCLTPDERVEVVFEYPPLATGAEGAQLLPLDESPNRPLGDPEPARDGLHVECSRSTAAHQEIPRRRSASRACTAAQNADWSSPAAAQIASSTAAFRIRQ